MQFQRMRGDMEFKIHQLEQEAYTSVLRAFRAQSDAVTWEKESLIAELRKELRVSDDEHRELSTVVNADDTVRKIREWRQAGGHDMLPSPTTSFHKKQKTSQSASLVYGRPMQDLHSQPVSMQPTHLAPKQRPGFGSGGRRTKSGQSVPGLSSMRSFSGLPGRGHLIHRTSSSAVLTYEPSEAARSDPLVGKRVMTRWPADNNFYDAVITDYNPVEGRHALVYDINTPTETWEWVNLKEISPEDIRWLGEDPGIVHQRFLEISNSLSHRAAPGPVGERVTEDQSLNGGREPDEIEILDTETLIKEVEKVFDTSHPSLAEIEKAKKLLKEHEQTLVTVIEKLADESDTESDGDCQIAQEQPTNGGPRDMQLSENRT